MSTILVKGPTQRRLTLHTHWCQGCDEVMPEKDMRWARDMFLCRYCCHDLGIPSEHRRKAFTDQQPEPTTPIMADLCYCALCAREGHWDGYPGGELCTECVWGGVRK